MPSLRARRRSHDETAAMSSRNTMVVSAGSNIILARNEYPFRLRRGQSLAFNEPQQRRSDNLALLFSLIEGQDLVCVALDVPGIVLLEAEKIEVSDLPDDLRLEASKYASSVIGTDQAVSSLLPSTARPAAMISRASVIFHPLPASIGTYTTPS